MLSRTLFSVDSEKPELPKPDLHEVADEASDEVDDDYDGSDLSPKQDSDSEFLALVSDEERERLHQKNLFAIASPDSGLPSIRFTSEESLRVEELLRLDRESMIAFGDTLRERNRVNHNFNTNGLKRFKLGNEAVSLQMVLLVPDVSLRMRYLIVQK